MTHPLQKDTGPSRSFPSLKELCKRHHIRFKKALGQNLLLDDNINKIMTDAAELTEQDGVIEVGAGLGALTKRILFRAGSVLAMERIPVSAGRDRARSDSFSSVQSVPMGQGI